MVPDSQAEILMTESTYNEIGQLIEKNLHSENLGITFLQSADYRYNIRGWLTSINNRNLTSDAGVTNDDTNDLFGMELKYESGLQTGAGTAQYNGNIAELLWKEANTSKLQGYAFSYDEVNRLKNSSYRVYTTNWTSVRKTIGTMKTLPCMMQTGISKTLTGTVTSGRLITLPTGTPGTNS